MLTLMVASVVLIGTTFCDKNENLVSVVLVYRHGDRTPVDPYPTDPYRNASYWPVGFGQLTNLGKWQHYLLGRWLRARYDGFLPRQYSENDVYIRSTDVDRTLMSAEANLAGLFPPKNSQVWDPDIPWQPIPVHTAPQLEDNLLAMKKNCPMYNKLLHQLLNTEYFVNISRKNHDLYTYLTKNSGTNIATLENVEYLYNTLFIERFYNLTLPQWAQSVFPDKIKPWADFSFAVPCYTSDMARLRTGPLFHNIIEHFSNATNNSINHQKFLVFSGHDINIANLLNTMGAFEPHAPPYTSTIIFELHSITSGYHINIFYKNSSTIQNITLKGCDFDCRIDDFIEILRPITITRRQWNIECQLGWFYTLHFDSLQFLLILGALASFTVVLLSVFCIIQCSKKSKRGDNVYMQLPDDEEA